MKTPALLALFLLLAHALAAQPFLDAVRLDWDNGFRRPYRRLPAKARFTEVALDLSLPVVLKNRNAIMTGLNAERIALRSTADSLDMTLYGMSLKIGVNLSHASNWSGTYMVLPRYAAGMGKSGKKDWQAGLLALLKYQPAPNKSFRFGFFVNTEAFGPFVIPLLGFYRSTSRLEINALLPSTAEINYQFSRLFSLGIKFNGSIKSYATGEDRDTYLVKNNNEVGLISYLKRGKLVWYVHAGASVGRSYRSYAADDKLSLAVSFLKFGDQRRQLNDDVSDGLFLKTGLLLRLKTN